MSSLLRRWWAVRSMTGPAPAVEETEGATVGASGLSLLGGSKSEEDSKQRLIRSLSEEQREQFTLHGQFLVKGGSTGLPYVIQCGSYIGNVWQIKDGVEIPVVRSDRILASLCCYPRTVRFLHDAFLIQKLAVETNEKYFVETACIAGTGGSTLMQVVRAAH